MGKSYRKPYASICGVRSCNWYKTRARRSVRREQNQALRDAIAQSADWDGFLVPAKLECSDNEVYGWNRDGIQWLQTRGSQYNNPFKYCRFWWRARTEEEILSEWEEDKARTDEWLRKISRK